jgi:hypothetical protein
VFAAASTNYDLAAIRRMKLDTGVSRTGGQRSLQGAGDVMRFEGLGSIGHCDLAGCITSHCIPD